MNSPPEKSVASEPCLWEQGWEGHELQQLQRLAALSLPEKIAWLEEAHRLVRQMAMHEKPETNSDQIR